MDQALGMISLVPERDGGPATPQPQWGCEAVGQGPLSRERVVDPAARLSFVLRASGEQNAQVETVLDSFGANVVRSKRTGWLVLKVAAQAATVSAAPGALWSPSSPIARTASCAEV